MIRRKIIATIIGAAIALGLVLLAFVLPQPARYATVADKLLWIVMIVSLVVLAGLIWTRFRQR